jgi:hypothetical protein
VCSPAVRLLQLFLILHTYLSGHSHMDYIAVLPVTKIGAGLKEERRSKRLVELPPACFERCLYGDFSSQKTC